MGALLISPALGPLGGSGCAAESASRGDAMAFPDEVLAQTDSGGLSLKSNDRMVWSGESVVVRLREESGALKVEVQSPRAPLRSVTLVWKHDAKPGAMHLGDAWERAYGDLAWRKIDKARIMPWYAMEHDGAAAHGFGVKTGCAAMCYWQAGEGTLKLVLDVRCGGRGVELGTRVLMAAEVVARKGREGESPFQATQAFCRLMCAKPLLPREPMVGMLDWYYTYGKCTDKLFVDEAALLASLIQDCGVKGFALVDAGWAPGDRSAWHEDQTRSHPDFGSIEGLAAKVSALGLTPGLWTRVLCTNGKDPEEFRLPRDRIFLDPSLPANLDRIRNLMRLFRKWGFGVIKHDFTTFDIFGRWGPQMGATLTNEGWAFRDRTRTTAEIILGLYRAIREGCGEDALIIGCNTVSHLSAGLVEYFRVGDDSGNNLERAMKYGPNPFAFRLPQHGTFYAADPDCVSNLKDIPWKYNRQFLRLVSESGALLELSTRIGALTEVQRDAIRAAFKRIGRKDRPRVEPLDWMERSIPVRWRIGDSVVEMDWDLTNP